MKLKSISARIFLAEDNPADVYLIRQALKEQQITSDLTVIDDGESALHALELLATDPSRLRPDLVLLDLNLPKMDGADVLKRIRQLPGGESIPVVVMTSSDEPEDRSAAERLGAVSYFRKPATLDEFMEIGKVVRNLCGGA